METSVLVVDDDQEIREMLASTITFSGFTVTTAADAFEALALLRSRDFDAVVLDVMMPGLDGFELVQLLRRQDSITPVLFLSARDEVEDRVRGLRLGGDDYVTKPFSTVEVIARLETLLRRRDRGGGEPDVLVCADLRLDRAGCTVRRGDASIDLTATEFRLLELLMSASGRVVSKAQILDSVWQYDFGGDGNVVEKFISSLRRKIDRAGPSLIRTVRGFGYAIRPPDQP